MEIPGLYQRLGVLPDEPDTDVRQEPGSGNLLRAPRWLDLHGQRPIPSPMFSIARRIAVNRERIGVHYPSDSFASRHLAAGLWDAILRKWPRHFDGAQRGNPCYEGEGISVPTLYTIMSHAMSEWVARK